MIFFTNFPMRRGFIIVEKYIIKGFVQNFCWKKQTGSIVVVWYHDHLLLGIQTTQACWYETIIKLNIKGPVKYLLTVQNGSVGIFLLVFQIFGQNFAKSAIVWSYVTAALTYDKTATATWCATSQWVSASLLFFFVTWWDQLWVFFCTGCPCLRPPNWWHFDAAGSWEPSTSSS